MDAVRESLYAAASKADVLLVEGVMGLFDGQTLTAADLAQELGLPVLAVVDAAAMAGTFGALVLGMQQYQPQVRWAGVVANRVAHDAHARMLQASLRDEGLWLGALPPVRADPVGDPSGQAGRQPPTMSNTASKTSPLASMPSALRAQPQADSLVARGDGAAGGGVVNAATDVGAQLRSTVSVTTMAGVEQSECFAQTGQAQPGLHGMDTAVQPAPGRGQGGGGLFPERHLGLVSVAELPDALERLDALADALAATPLGQMDWPQWQRRWSVRFDPLPPGRQPHIQPWLQGRTVAVARDAAFSFIYPANLECLERMGARLAFFSPLAGDGLPACDALWLPGGYPELHAARLGANFGLQAGLRAHVAAGKPVWAECGGMVALGRAIILADGTRMPLWDILPGEARMQSRLAGLGMQQCSVRAGVDGAFTGDGVRDVSTGAHADASADMGGDMGRDMGRGAVTGQTAAGSQGRSGARSVAGEVEAIGADVLPGVLRGHTFHYSRFECVAPVVAHTSRPSATGRCGGLPAAVHPRPGEAVYAWGSVHASYFHAWFASHPAAVAALLGALPLQWG